MKKLTMIKVVFYLMLVGLIHLCYQSKNEINIEYSHGDYVVREGDLIRFIGDKENAYKIYNNLINK